MKRTVFFISDGTGITSEAFGNALLAQFEKIEFERITVPYIDDEAKARALVDRINESARVNGERPLVFDTIVKQDIRDIVSRANGLLVDIFGAFLSGLEQELRSSSSCTVGRSRSIGNASNYERRINAVNFAMDSDDGARTWQYDKAHLILVGASRCGKTPTCLYLALHYGVRAANYPITEEDLTGQQLPEPLRSHRDRLFGLTIDPQRLAAIRNERRPNTRYASLKQCTREIDEIETMYQRERIPFLNTTVYSVEEISTRIMLTTGLRRHR